MANIVAVHDCNLPEMHYTEDLSLFLRHFHSRCLLHVAPRRLLFAFLSVFFLVVDVSLFQCTARARDSPFRPGFADDEETGKDGRI